MSRLNLVIFTISYPYGKQESTFLPEELNYLSKSFNKIVLVPGYKYETVNKILPENVVIDDSLAFDGKIRINDMLKSIGKCFSDTLFFREIRNNFFRLFNVEVIKNLTGAFYGAVLIRDWIVSRHNEGKLRETETIYYSYWFGKFTLGMVFAKQILPGMRIITRGHGRDIYLERTPNGYSPFQNYVINSSLLDKYFIISENGKNYLGNKFPIIKNKIYLSRLGTKNPGFVSNYSTDNILRLVSCSEMVKVKRLELLIGSLEIIDKNIEQVKIHWTHIGDGPEFDILFALAKKKLSNNVTFLFTGYLSNKEVYQYYKNNKIDYFINVSSSEGIPVTIMEALSAGIPAIATNVGGSGEIVTEETGCLLPRDIAPCELAGYLIQITKNLSASQRNGVQKKCIEFWKNNFNSDDNYSKFAHEISGLN